MRGKHIINVTGSGSGRDRTAGHRTSIRGQKSKQEPHRPIRGPNTHTALHGPYVGSCMPALTGRKSTSQQTWTQAAQAPNFPN